MSQKMRNQQIVISYNLLTQHLSGPFTLKLTLKRNVVIAYDTVPVMFL